MRNRTKPLGVVVRYLVSMSLLALGAPLACSSSPDSVPTDGRVVSTELANQLNLAPLDRIAVTVVYTFEPTPQIERALHQANTEKHKAQVAFSDAIADRGAEIQLDLQRAGIEVVRRSRMYPAIFALATKEQIEDLAGDARVLRIGLTHHQGRGTLFTDGPVTGPTNTMSYPRMTTFKTNAYSGANQSVGIVETGACALYDDHVAFHWNNVSYQDTPWSCIGDGDCGKPCGFGVDDYQQAACLDGRCVVRHATGVAGAVAATTDFGYGAYRAHLYYANKAFNPDGSAVACDDDKIDDAYSWFMANGVTTVVESWGCGLPTDADGPLQDWYAMRFDFTVVRAGGNDPQYAACPYFHNGLCVGSATSLKGYLNPNDGPHHDREEPDVVTLADDVLVPSMSDAARGANARDWWTNRARHFPEPEYAVAGSSFAAPVVAAAVALMKDACNNRQPGSLLPQLVRARIMAGAYLADPFHDGGYSTPVADCPVGGACDHKDGAGLLYGDALLDFCGYHLTGNESSSTTIDLDPFGDPGQYTAPTPTDPKYGPTKAGYGLGSVFLKTDETLREVISWNTCARYRARIEDLDEKGNPVKGNSLADFDLWLHNNTTNQWVDSVKSVSYDDNNEGFQFTAPADGTYEPIVVWKSGQVRCGTVPETVAEARVWGKYIPGPPP